MLSCCLQSAGWVAIFNFWNIQSWLDWKFQKSRLKIPKIKNRTHYTLTTPTQHNVQYPFQCIRTVYNVDYSSVRIHHHLIFTTFARYLLFFNEVKLSSSKSNFRCLIRFSTKTQNQLRIKWCSQMCANFCRTCYSRLQRNELTSRRRDALHRRILFCWLRDPIKSSFELISGFSTIWYWHVSVVLCERSQPTITKSSISFLRYMMMNATHQASRLLALISIDIAGWGGMITGTNTLTMSESLRFFTCRFVFCEWDVWVVIDRSFLEGEKSWHHDGISWTQDEMFEKSIRQTSCIKWLLRRTVQLS